jgi:hypothetical protein
MAFGGVGMIGKTPPRWMEALLLLLLPERSRETITGDLFEEFCDRSVRRGYIHASLWYARQVVSFAPQQLKAVESPVLTMLCLFTASCGLWLGAVDLAHRSAGYAGREFIAVQIVLQSIVALGAVHLHRVGSVFKPFAVIGSLGLMWRGGQSIIAALRGRDVEGYVILIGLALIVQAILTLKALSFDRAQPQPNV